MLNRFVSPCVMTGMRRLSIAAGAAVVAAAGVGVAATSVSAHPASHTVTVKTRQVSPYGTILTTSSGRTLYLYSKDTKGHSHCTDGECTAEWPALIVPKGDKITGVSGLGTIKRGSKRQAALHGKPLYRFAGDTGAGQVKGQGEDGDWFVATPNGASHTAKPSPKPTKSSPPSGGGYGY